MQGFLKQPKPKPGTRSDNQSRNEDHRGKRAKVFEAGHLGSAISSSFAHASHWRQAAANCIFASSSVDARTIGAHVERLCRECRGATRTSVGLRGPHVPHRYGPSATRRYRRCNPSDPCRSERRDQSQSTQPSMGVFLRVLLSGPNPPPPPASRPAHSGFSS
jgi:hypothetical protein